MEDSPTSQRVFLETLSKSIEVKISEEIRSIFLDAVSSVRFREIPQEVLEFTVKLKTSSDQPPRWPWLPESPCGIISGWYEPDTREMIIYIDRLLYDQYGIRGLRSSIETTLFYLIIRHLQHTAPHLTISASIIEPGDKYTALEVEACLLSIILSNLPRLEENVFTFSFIRSHPLLEVFLSEIRGGKLNKTYRVRLTEKQLYKQVDSLASHIEPDFEKLRYFVKGKPVALKLVNDSGMEWSIIVKSLRLSDRAVVLENTGEGIMLYYLRTSTYEYYRDEVEVVLEEPVEVNTAKLQEIIFHPGDQEIYIEFISQDTIEQRRAWLKPEGKEEIHVFKDLGEALRKISEAKIPVELPKPKCERVWDLDQLIYTLPRVVDSTWKDEYHLAMIKLFLAPGSCPEEKSDYTW